MAFFLANLMVSTSVREEPRAKKYDLRGTPLPNNLLTLEVIGQSVSMPYLATYLTARFVRVVINRTGLQGEFGFKVQVALDEHDLSDKQAAVATAMSNASPNH